MASSRGETTRNSWLLCAALAGVFGLAGRAAADTESCAQAHEQAQLARLHGQLVSARAALLTCAQASCPALVRDDCSPWLAEVERALPSVVFAVDDGQGHDLIDVRVSSSEALIAERADGRALPLDPGMHTLRFEAQGFAPHSAVISMREGEKQRLVRVSLRALREQPARSATSGRPVQQRSARLFRSTYALLGVGAAGLAVGTASALRWNAMAKHCDRAPAEGEAVSCSPAYHQRGERMYLGVNIGFAVGGVALGAAALTLWQAFRHKHREAAGAAAPVSVSAGWNGAGMSFALHAPL